MPTSPWYVTAPSARWTDAGGQRQRGPAERAHAKTMGATRTVCGEYCVSWPKFLHLPYLPGRGGISCRRCDLLVSGAMVSSAAEDGRPATGARAQRPVSA